MNGQFVPANRIVKRFGISNSTLQQWHRKGKINAIRSPGGKRFYNIHQIEKLFHVIPENQICICYARVSSSHQKEDLARQVDSLGKEFPNYKIYEEIGSGLNFERKKFKTILELVCKGLVKRLVVMYKDRLCRFGFEMFKQICEFHKCELLVLNSDPSKPKSYSEELSEDLLSIINFYVAKNNGRRASQNRQRRAYKERKSDEQSI